MISETDEDFLALQNFGIKSRVLTGSHTETCFFMFRLFKLLMGSVVVAASLQPVFPEIVYVNADASGNNDGTSWDNAYKSLRSATDTAVSGDEIWVAAGVYKPTGGASRIESFTLVDGVSLYGGFIGVENSREERNADPLTNGCVLSGDLAGDDAGEGLDFQNYADNSLNIIDARGAAGVVVDGFKITGGNANQTADTRERGAGVYLWEDDTARLENLWFDRNLSQVAGGGLYANGSEVAVIRCRFTHNQSGSGGAVYLNRSEGWLLSSEFFGNRALLDGGAFRAFFCELAVHYCAFSGNVAERNGGVALLSGDVIDLGIKQCSFANNSAAEVGGLYAVDGRVSIQGCIFWNNTGDLDANYGPDESMLHSSTRNNLTDADPRFVDPLGPDGVAGTLDDNLRLRPDSPAIDAGVNVQGDLFDVNGDGLTSQPYPIDADGNPNRLRAYSDGGAYEESDQRILYVDASARDGEGTSYSWDDAALSLEYALSVSLDGDEIWVASGVYRPVSDDPATAVAWIRKSVALYGGFAGDEESLNQRPVRDIAGGSTILSGERGSQTDPSDNHSFVVRIDAGKTVTLDRFTIEGAYTKDSGAIDGAGVNAGTGVDLRIVDCVIQDNRANGGGGGIVAIDPAVLEIEDTVIRRNETNYQGGGLGIRYNSGTEGNVVLQNVFFLENKAGESGGGASVQSGANTRVERSVFFRNHSDSSGGGLRIGGGAEVENCWFVENTAGTSAGLNATSYKGGSSSITVEASAFWGNNATLGVSAIGCESNDSITAIDCVFAGNWGASLLRAGTGLELLHCSVAENVVSNGSGSLLAVFQNGGSVVLNNTVIRFTPVGFASVFDRFDDVVSIDSSLIEGESGFVDPVFRRSPDSGDGDWRTYSDNDYGYLRPTEESPLLNAGDSELMGRTEDFAGTSRLVLGGGNISIGAFESPEDFGFSSRYPSLPANADFNGDQIDNGRAFLLGRSPFEDNVFESELKLREGTDRRLYLEFDQRIDVDGFGAALYQSPDLQSGTWVGLDEVAPGEVETTDVSPTRQQVRISWEALMQEESAHFVEIGSVPPEPAAASARPEF